MFKAQAYYYNNIKFCFDRLGSKTNLYVWVQTPRKTGVHTTVFKIKNNLVDWSQEVDSTTASFLNTELKDFVQVTLDKILVFRAFW